MPGLGIKTTCGFCVWARRWEKRGSKQKESAKRGVLSKHYDIIPQRRCVRHCGIKIGVANEHNQSDVLYPRITDSLHLPLEPLSPSRLSPPKGAQESGMARLCKRSRLSLILILVLVSGSCTACKNPRCCRNRLFCVLAPYPVVPCNLILPLSILISTHSNLSR